MLRARSLIHKANPIKNVLRKGTVTSSKLHLSRNIVNSNINIINPVGFKKLNVRDPLVFQQKQISKLIFHYAILKCCSFPLLTTVGPVILDYLEKLRLSAPAYYIIKNTFYRHFVAGENIDESLKVVENLGSQGVSSILDYSIESFNDNVEEVVQTLIETIKLSKTNRNTEFSCFKMTALTSTHLLGRINELIEKNPINNIPWENLPKFEKFSELIEYLLPIVLNKEGNSEYLNDQELNEVRNLVSRIERLAEAANHYNVSVLVDAEQSYYQKAISFLVIAMSRQYNTERPVFYNTYQMYAKNALVSLMKDVKSAEKHGFIIGAKIVRGAYMESERQRASELGLEDPIHPTIEDTHKSFNSSIKFMLEEIKNGSKCALLIASHNEESIVYATELMYELELENNHKQIHFAQLYGMNDHISLSLSQNNYNICKYIPFGPVKLVMPYLIRRMIENKDVVGKTKVETDLIAAELKRRFNKLLSDNNEIELRQSQA